MRPRLLSRARQRGAAILLAMLIMTLVATLAAGMVWLQWRGIEVESAERARGQGEWLLNGALDWGRLILRSAGRANSSRADLGQPWAMPLAESRLSTFLSTDANHADDSGPDAFLSGQITDAQSRFNVAALYMNTTGRLEQLRFERLCEAIGVPASTADLITAGLGQSYSFQQSLDENSAQKDTGYTVLMPSSAAQLAWYGIDPAYVRQLEPFIEFLPQPTKVNVNTAPAEVLMAAMYGISRAEAQMIVQQRQAKPFDAIDDPRLPKAPSPAASGVPAFNIDVNSQYFEIYGQLRYEQHVLREQTLVQRAGYTDVKVIRRERLPPDVQ